MNRKELIDAMAKEANLTKAATESALSAFIATITKTLKKGDSVQLVGFGTFAVSKRAARSGRNPATGATLKIAATRVAKFKVGAALKTAVSGK